MVDINCLIENIEHVKKGKTKYYNAVSFYDMINQTENVFVKTDILIVPFYFPKGVGTYELYEYEANIVKVKKSNFNNYIENIYKKNITKINSVIIEEKRTRYIEIVDEDYSEVKAKLIKYLFDLLNSNSLKNEILNNFNEFLIDNIFLAFY